MVVDMEREPLPDRARSQRTFGNRKPISDIVDLKDDRRATALGNGAREECDHIKKLTAFSF